MSQKLGNDFSMSPKLDHAKTDQRGGSLVDLSWRRSLAGGIAAACGKTITAPLERVRIIRQAATRGSSSAPSLLSTIYEQEGVRGLWRGNAVNLSRVVPSYAIRFTAFGNLSDYGNKFPILANPFVAGALAGTTSAIASYPLEVIRTRISISGSLMEAFKTGRLFAGCSLTILETTPYAGLTLGTYNYLRANHPAASQYMIIVHGIVAGAVGTLVCFPVDTLRRNKMVRSQERVGEIARSLFNEGGLGRFYRGLSIALIKACPTVAVTMVVNDIFLRQLGVS
jgi:hypothetical protein